MTPAHQSQSPLAIYHLLPAMYCVKTFMSTNSLNLHNMVPSTAHTIVSPFYIQRNKDRKSKWLTQGHLISKWQKHMSNTRYLAPESTLHIGGSAAEIWNCVTQIKRVLPSVGDEQLLILGSRVLCPRMKTEWEFWGAGAPWRRCLWAVSEIMDSIDHLEFGKFLHRRQRERLK